MGYLVDQEEFERMENYRVYLKAHMTEATDERPAALLLGVKRVEIDRPDDFGSFDYVKIRLAETIVAKISRLVARCLVALTYENAKRNKVNPKYMLNKYLSEFIHNFKHEVYYYSRRFENVHG